MGLFGGGSESGRFDDRLNKIASPRKTSEVTDEAAERDAIANARTIEEVEELRTQFAKRYEKRPDVLEILTDLLNARRARIEADKIREKFSGEA